MIEVTGLLGLLLAWVNGANDVAKGVATLAGSGMAHARRAVLWGTLWRCWTALHWLSSVTTSFARGLNDVPKIAAFLILASTLDPDLAPRSEAAGRAWPTLGVTLTMGLGSLWGGFRVLRILAHRVTPLDPQSGLLANAGTSLVVLMATPLGLPVSTTHVSAGAWMGIRWADKGKPQEADALRLILLGWVVTLPVAAALAALSLFLIKLL